MASTIENADSDDPDSGKPSAGNAEKENASKQTPVAIKTLLRTWTRRFYFLGTTILILVFLFSLLGRHFFLAELLGHLRLYLFVALLFACAVSYLVKRKWLAIPLAIATIWSSTALLMPYIPAAQPQSGKTQIHVMSFNLLGINTEFETALKMIRNNDPDVVTLIEFANEWADVFDGSKNVYPHQVLVPRWHGYGIAILSKIPIDESRVIQLLKEKTDCPMIEAKLTVDGKPVRLLAVHLFSPTNQHRANLRNVQLQEIADIANESPEPTVLLGDFNCTPWSPFIGDLIQETGLRDSRRGFGYQASWHNQISALKIPIDHAFVSPKIHVHDRYIGKGGGSDHMPLNFKISVSDD